MLCGAEVGGNVNYVAGVAKISRKLQPPIASETRTQRSKKQLEIIKLLIVTAIALGGAASAGTDAQNLTTRSLAAFPHTGELR
jgi:hypothetical protein